MAIVPPTNSIYGPRPSLSLHLPNHDLQHHFFLLLLVSHTLSRLALFFSLSACRVSLRLQEKNTAISCTQSSQVVLHFVATPTFYRLPAFYHPSSIANILLYSRLQQPIYQRNHSHPHPREDQRDSLQTILRLGWFILRSASACSHLATFLTTLFVRASREHHLPPTSLSFDRASRDYHLPLSLSALHFYEGISFLSTQLTSPTT